MTTRIIVKKVEVLNIHKSPKEVLISTNPHRPYDGKPSDRIKEEDIQCIKEAITCEQFYNTNGDIVHIGMSKQAQEALGLPFKAYDQMKKDCEDIRIDRDNYYNKCCAYYDVFQNIEELGFWGRLKYLLTGNIKGKSLFILMDKVEEDIHNANRK